jgi:hypothetical protein
VRADGAVLAKITEFSLHQEREQTPFSFFCEGGAFQVIQLREQ